MTPDAAGFVPRGEAADVVRVVTGVSGRVRRRMQLRFNYGRMLPWVRTIPGSLRRTSEAEDLYRRLLAVPNHLGLLAEEYDTTGAARQRPSFSHIALVNTARPLSGGDLTPG